jgi:hypothetical protein
MNSLSKTYVVNFTKVKTPQGTPHVMVIQGVVKLTRSCGEIDQKLWWTCGGLVVDLW